MIADEACYERGCACHDSRESAGIEVTAKKPWVGLTDVEITAIVGLWGSTPVTGYTRQLFDQVEAKLKEKNT